VTNQPVWKKIGTVGDINPIDYDGGFIYHDETGVYPAELEYVIGAGDENAWGEYTEWLVYRMVLDRLEEMTGLKNSPLVPFGFGSRNDLPYPLGSYEEWFCKDLGSVADCIGLDVDGLREMLCSEDEQRRAFGYLELANYFGWENFDGYPLHFTSREELEARYKEDK
jgi:hypothetical protein